MKITLEHHGLKPIKIPEGPGEFNIGWEEGNDFIMTPRIPGISRTHFIIIQEGRCNIFLVDNSKNGTLLNGTEVSSGAKNRVKLKDGDTIRLGGREEGEMPLAEFTVRIES